MVGPKPTHSARLKSSQTPWNLFGSESLSSSQKMDVYIYICNYNTIITIVYIYMYLYHVYIYMCIYMFFPNNLRIGRIIQKSSKFTFDKCWIPKPSSHRPTRPPDDVQSGPIDATLRCDALCMAQKNRVPHGLLIEKILKNTKNTKKQTTICGFVQDLSF